MEQFLILNKRFSTIFCLLVCPFGFYYIKFKTIQNITQPIHNEEINEQGRMLQNFTD